MSKKPGYSKEILRAANDLICRYEKAIKDIVGGEDEFAISLVWQNYGRLNNIANDQEVGERYRRIDKLCQIAYKDNHDEFCGSCWLWVDDYKCCHDCTLNCSVCPLWSNNKGSCMEGEACHSYLELHSIVLDIAPLWKPDNNSFLEYEKHSEYRKRKSKYRLLQALKSRLQWILNRLMENGITPMVKMEEK